jgi:hypothetical protein
MIKNFITLLVLTWVSLSYAAEKKYFVVKDSMAEAENYKVEKPSPEQDAQRSLAGSKIKKKKANDGDEPQKMMKSTEESDSEVRYWQYSE